MIRCNLDEILVKREMRNINAMLCDMKIKHQIGIINIMENYLSDMFF